MPINEIINGFLEVADKYGLFTALVVFLIIAHYWFIYWLIRQIIKSKDKEIERLVENRNELQKEFLKRSRLSTKRSEK
jgi:hypothetical protein